MLNKDQQQQLLEICKASVHEGLAHQRPYNVVVQDYEEALQLNGACFVTLNINHHLRGCIGSLEAYRPLVIDVAENAYAAAFRDPRFPPVTKAESEKLEYHVSVLQPSTAMDISSEQELIHSLRPEVDGLILEEAHHRATFLPSVWESLPDATSFIAHLKQKAGLPADYWSESIKFSRYEVQEFS